MNNGNGNHEIVMTADEVSRFLKIPLSTLYGLTKKGKIQGSKVGKHWRYLEADIFRYLRGENRPAQLEEQRQHPRINCRIQGRIHPTLSSAIVNPQEGTLENLSEQGAFFTGKYPEESLREGDPVSVAFEIAENQIIETSGRIVHRRFNQQPYYGIKFRGLSEGQKEIIREYVG